jgi:hypothetical protein
MKEYIAYKAWWIQHQSPRCVASGQWPDTAEEAFEQHINDLGLYQLMEILTDEWITQL